jgi:hypothetical protein
MIVKDGLDRVHAFLSDGGEDRIQSQLEDCSVLINLDGNLKVIESASSLNIKGKKYTIVEQNQRYIVPKSVEPHTAIERATSCSSKLKRFRLPS